MIFSEIEKGVKMSRKRKKEETYIAHIREDCQADGNKVIQNVEEHCINVANYAKESGRWIGLEATMCLAGLLHDVGKSTSVFNEYILKAFEDYKSVRKGEVNHSSAGGRFVFEFFSENIKGKYNSGRKKLVFLARQLLAYAIVSHHGIIDCLDAKGKSPFKGRIYPEKENYYDEAISNADYLEEDSLKELFVKSVSEVERYWGIIGNVSKTMNPNNNGKSAYFLFGCLQRMILSMLIDADRRDTSEFMSDLRTHRLSMEETTALWKCYEEKLNAKLASFKHISDIAKLRGEMSDYCVEFAKKNDGIYRLSIPTGGGKTLASMRYALRFAQRTGKSRIFYLAPFLSILEQNATELKAIFEDEENILEHHSNVIFDESDESGEDEMLRKYESLAEDWSSPMILTTMVQFLNVLFSGGTRYIRRFHQLKNSVLIIDEAQSVPVNCIHLFTTMCNFLNQCCNTTIILCTATQPLFEKVERRILLNDEPDMIPDAEKYAKLFKRVDIENAMIPGGFDTNEFCDFIEGKLKNNMLIILNTKSAVKNVVSELQNRLDENTRIVELTTYMCAAHRIEIVKSLKEELRKNTENSVNAVRIICVSTQLIEAGVDISFECVIRSLSGLDSIAQAAGRCNRHGELKKGMVYIVDYKEEKTAILKDIQAGKEATRAVANFYKGDFLMPDAMRYYYKQYYFDRKREMDYWVGKQSISLFELLSANSSYQNDYKSVNGIAYDQVLPQAFKTAGDLFSAIDNHEMVGIIVPYKEAKEYIQSLKNTSEAKRRKKYLRKLQRYTVNVFKNDKLFRSLLGKGAFEAVLPDGKILVLGESFYKEAGLSDELELMVF